VMKTAVLIALLCAYTHADVVAKSTLRDGERPRSPGARFAIALAPPKLAAEKHLGRLFNVDIGKAFNVDQIEKSFNVDSIAKAVDTTLAGFGLALSLGVLGGVLEPRLGVRLFVPPMMASSIIFFAGSTPPDPKGFLLGTLCASTAGTAIFKALAPRMPIPYVQGAAAGTLLMWYKATGCIFPSAAVLAGLIAAADVTWCSAEWCAVAPNFPGSYVVFPWLAGHAFIYGSAFAMSKVRSTARVAITKTKLRSLSSMTDAQLKEIFNKFDTSGDGALDATEMRLALRVAVGADLPMSECEKIVQAADCDGNGLVEFSEFVAICKQL